MWTTQRASALRSSCKAAQRVSCCSWNGTFLKGVDPPRRTQVPTGAFAATRRLVSPQQGPRRRRRATRTRAGLNGHPSARANVQKPGNGKRHPSCTQGILQLLRSSSCSSFASSGCCALATKCSCTATCPGCPPHCSRLKQRRRRNRDPAGCATGSDIRDRHPAAHAACGWSILCKEPV